MVVAVLFRHTFLYQSLIQSDLNVSQHCSWAQLHWTNLAYDSHMFSAKMEIRGRVVSMSRGNASEKSGSYHLAVVVV